MLQEGEEIFDSVPFFEVKLGREWSSGRENKRLQILRSRRWREIGRREFRALIFTLPIVQHCLTSLPPPWPKPDKKQIPIFATCRMYQVLFSVSDQPCDVHTAY